MKKILYVALLFSVSLLIVGCGEKDSVVSGHNKYNNAIECTNTTDKFVIYFDNEDKVIGFDFYSTASSDDVTEEVFNNAKEKTCAGERGWKKEWMKICDFTRDSKEVNAHIYVDNAEWFGEDNTKEKVKISDVGDIKSMTCIDK